jgi:nitrous oxidase accessory protein
MNERGNGIYIWNSPGTVVEGNASAGAATASFSNASKKGTYRNNLFRDLRFAVHYMYTHDTEVSGNISIGNHLGFAIMFSDRVVVLNNLSLGDREHGRDAELRQQRRCGRQPGAGRHRRSASSSITPTRT